MERYIGLGLGVGLGFVGQRGESLGEDSRIKFCEQHLSDPIISSHVRTFNLFNEVMLHNQSTAVSFSLWGLMDLLPAAVRISWMSRYPKPIAISRGVNPVRSTASVDAFI